MRVTKEKNERRLELVSVAARLFATRGYAQTGVSDIVREAGVAQGTFYYHFRSKEDILVAVVHTTVDELERRLVAIVEDKGKGPTERIQALLASVFEFVGSKGDLIAFVHMDANALLHHRLMGTAAMMIKKHLLALVQEGVAGGHFQVAYPEEAVGFFLGGLTGALHTPELTEDPGYAARFRAMAETALLRGLGL